MSSLNHNWAWIFDIDNDIWLIGSSHNFECPRVCQMTHYRGVLNQSAVGNKGLFREVDVGESGGREVGYKEGSKTNLNCKSEFSY